MFALVTVGDDGDRAVELVTDDAPRQVLARDLPALIVERVAVAVIGRHAENADVAVVFQPAQLAIVGDVAAQEEATFAAPGWPLQPQRRLALDVAVPYALAR